MCEQRSGGERPKSGDEAALTAATGSEMTREERRIHHMKIVERAKKVLKPGDRCRGTKCPGTKRTFTFAGWDVGWIVSKSGINDYFPGSLDRVNGQPVDFTKDSFSERKRGGIPEKGQRRMNEKDSQQQDERTDGDAGRDCPPSSGSADELAKRIAEDILTVGASGGPVTCTRAVMMKGKYPDGECDMGGRNAASIAFVVKEHLIAAGYPPNKN